MRMNRKPSRAFIYLALVMVLMLVISLVVVGALVSENALVTGDDWTAPAALATNSVMVENAIQTQTFMYFIGETATNLRGLEPPPGYFETSAAEEKTEVFQVNASLGATETAKYWATETAFLPKLLETMTQMSIEDTLTQTPAT